MAKVNESRPRGGNGGDVKLIGDSGLALGGKGGRGGAKGFGQGGDGASNTQCSSCVSIGGNGGDAGRPARPALGGASSLERDTNIRSWPTANLVDDYGIYSAGRGGDSYQASIKFENREYNFNVLLRLLEIWDCSIIDAVDSRIPKNEQAWWDKAIELFPDQSKRAMAHIRECEKIARDGGAPISPYE